MRKNFAEVLKDNKIDIKNEYIKLYNLFNEKKFNIYASGLVSIYDIIEDEFLSFPFRETCLSIDEFNQKHNFVFVENPNPFDIDILLNFIEYIYNLLLLISCDSSSYLRYVDLNFYFEHIEKIIDLIGYEKIYIDGVYVFVEKSPAAVAVAESDLMPKESSYKVIFYNHHSLKGNLEGKKGIILKLAEILEGKQSDLHKANQQLKSDLFYIFNNLNIRHNNCDKSAKEKYKKVIDEMPDDELEAWYDETYQMCLLAFLSIEHLERKNRFNELKNSIETDKD